MDTFRADVKKLLVEESKPATSTPATRKLYRVQIGAYSIKANAETQLAKAKKAGFTDAFIKYD
jgi:N-acetylmuramoyl-L-alanine amidase